MQSRPGAASGLAIILDDVVDATGAQKDRKLGDLANRLTPDEVAEEEAHAHR